MFRWIAIIVRRKASNAGEMASAHVTPEYFYILKLYYLILLTIEYLIIYLKL